MGNAAGALCKLDDIAVSTLMGWIAPMDIDVGPATISLEDADFADHDNNVTINLHGFLVQDVELLGGATLEDVPMMGDIDLTLRVLLDIIKDPSVPVRVDIKDIDFPDAPGMIQPILNAGMVQGPLQQSLEDAINEQIYSRISDDDDEVEE
mmetsp:Transcript_145922/g.254586  ORF Transcript_145922/g.254586 Transcript_145922/m.254586 type:complete len:151 (-) Transcript_145922:120-572(-)